MIEGEKQRKEKYDREGEELGKETKGWNKKKVKNYMGREREREDLHEGKKKISDKKRIHKDRITSRKLWEKEMKVMKKKEEIKTGKKNNKEWEKLKGKKKRWKW